ncbi:hypothetical protein MPSEU_000884600 [Mayamaea pseudoterrestris]|nr:hypothetical protein MPSEU_000884600 [Mayamaea pseudoterrestris]
MKTTVPISICNRMQETTDSTIQLVEDPELLLKCGVCRVKLLTDKVSSEQWQEWAHTLSRVTPEIYSAQADEQYAFYRNIFDEEDFPFDAILKDSTISQAIVKYFSVKSMGELRLDDAFLIQYHSKQADTSGARHTDPSDITINICLERTPDTTGSNVLFYGTKSLVVTDGKDLAALPASDIDEKPLPHTFLVKQEQGMATIHWGDHLHETTPLFSGKRTNIIMTLCYRDASRTKAMSRNCYA